MSDISLRLAVTQQLTAHLKADIVPSNGYPFDMSAVVFRGRLLYGADDPATMISILEAPEQDTKPDRVGDGTLATYQWRLLLQGWAKDQDSDNPTDDAANLLACMKKSLGKVLAKVKDRAYSGTAFYNIADIIIEPGVTRPAENMSEIGECLLEIVVKLVEDVADPFWSPP